VRTTLTLDDDVAARLTAEARRSGRSFKETVNDALRAGMEAKRRKPPTRRFEVHARDLGAVRLAFGLDSIAKVLEEVDGTDPR
jgi:plasmid stability protein